MSWVYLPELEGGYWRRISSDGTPCAPSRSTSIASECSRSGSATERSRSSPSGMTSAPSTASPGTAASTSLAEASLVRTSLAPDEAPDYQAHAAACGSRCSESLARYDLRMSSRRTPRCFALEDWMSFSEGLPTWGLMQRGVCSELGTSVRPTDATACGSLLPTPTGAGNEGSPSMQKWPAHRRLTTQLALLPTPTASSYGTNQGGAAGRVGKVRHNLEKTAQMAGLLPTPVARDHRHGGPADSRKRQGSPPLNEVAHQSGLTGGVFIALREWMMGWPLGWSACEPLATGRFPQWQRSHGEFCPTPSTSLNPEAAREPF